MTKICFFSEGSSWAVTGEAEILLHFRVEEEESGSGNGTLSFFLNSEIFLAEMKVGDNVAQETFWFEDCGERSARLIFTMGGNRKEFEVHHLANVGWVRPVGLPISTESTRWRFAKSRADYHLEEKLFGQRLVFDVFYEIRTGVNKNLLSMYESDQNDRAELPPTNSPDYDAVISTLAENDKRRRIRVQELLKSGALKGGADFYRAAFIFQHGDGPQDFLYAHHLALVALSLGFDDARWLAAASLDRFLQSIGRSQIYGSQWQVSGDDAKVIYAAPYDGAFIDFDQRSKLGVLPIHEE